MPYEDKSASFNKADVLSHIADYDKPTHREDKYKYVSAGIDWGRCLPLFIGI